MRLAPLGTDEHKPFLETAPWLIAIFAQKHGRLEDGRKVKHYYPTESVGLATGMLITALHHAGLATLTHTPSPMKFLNEILGRPKAAERPFLLLVVGYPDENATVPDVGAKAARGGGHLHLKGAGHRRGAPTPGRQGRGFRRRAAARSGRRSGTPALRTQGRRSLRGRNPPSPATRTVSAPRPPQSTTRKVSAPRYSTTSTSPAHWPSFGAHTEMCSGRIPS